MEHQFIVYLKNKTSQKFEYKSDVSSVVRTDKGYSVTFNSGKSYTYGAEKVKYYPYTSTREGVRIYENGKLNKRYNIVDYYGSYLIFRDADTSSNPVENSDNIEICDVKQSVEQAGSIIEYFRDILTNSGEISFGIPADESENKNVNQVSSGMLLKALGKIDVLEPRSALSNYLDGTNPLRNRSAEKLNPSQG